MTAKKIDIPEVVATGLLESAGKVRLTDDSDSTKYIDMAVSANRNFTVTEADNMIVQGRDASCFMQIQRAGNTIDGVTEGLSVGLNGSDAYLFHRDSGAFYIGNSGLTAITIDSSRHATFVANLSTNGAATLGDAADDAHTVNGTLALASEHATGPSAPAAGAGGIVYVKDDGKLYYISDNVPETDLTSGGGGGGLTITEVTSGATYSATTYDTMYLMNVAGNIEIDLPTAASQAGKTIDIMAVQGASYQVTVDPNGSETINGNSASYVISGVNYANLTLVSDGSNWVVR